MNELLTNESEQRDERTDGKTDRFFNGQEGKEREGTDGLTKGRTE